MPAPPPPSHADGDTPPDLMTPIGTDGGQDAQALVPNAGALWNTRPFPAGATDVFAYQVGGHSFVWRIDSEPPPHGSTSMVLDGQEIGRLAWRDVEPSRWFEGKTLPEPMLWGEPVRCELSETVRQSGSAARRLIGRSTSTLRCYDLTWRGHRWTLVMTAYPNEVGLWRGEPQQGLTGEPVVTFTGPRLRDSTARVSWVGGATLLELIVALVYGRARNSAHLATAKADIAKEMGGAVLG